MNIQNAKSDILALQRWGHCVVRGNHPNECIVFGGFGTHPKKLNHERLNDVLVVNTETQEITHLFPEGAGPAAHIYAAAIPLEWEESNEKKRAMFLFGGRSGPQSPMNDGYLLDLESNRWISCIWSTNSNTPVGRWKHTLSVAGNGSIYLHGGCGKNGTVFGDVYSLDIGSWTWKLISAGLPSRFSHTATVFGKEGEYIAFLGGMDINFTARNDVTILHVPTASHVTISIENFLPRFGHSAFLVSDKSLLVDRKRRTTTTMPSSFSLFVVGGIVVNAVTNLEQKFAMISLDFILQGSGETPWKAAYIPLEREPFASEHSLQDLDSELLLTGCGYEIIHENRIVLVGGGAIVFSMGSFFNKGLAILTLTSNKASQQLLPMPLQQQQQQQPSWNDFYVGQLAWKSNTHRDDDSSSTSTRVVFVPSESLVHYIPREDNNNNNDNTTNNTSMNTNTNANTKTDTVTGTVASYFSENMTEKEFEKLVSLPVRHPFVLRKVHLGKSVNKWKNANYLKEKVGSKSMAIHVSPGDQLDFVRKNFQYQTMNFDRFVDCVFNREENDQSRYYLRSLGENVRKEVSNFWQSFPTIADDFRLPDFCHDFIHGEREFSSAFRVSSERIQMWTHYDTMDNVLCQIVGRKRVILWAPWDVDKLYMRDSTSEIIDIDNPNIVEQYPLFAQAASRMEVILEPGDMIFIPSLWLHNIIALDPSISINVFWKHLPLHFYDKKDLYGNRDPIPATNALRSAEEIESQLSTLPLEYRDFYARKLCQRLQSFFLSPSQKGV